MSERHARLIALVDELREFLAAGEFQAMAYKLDELAALLREPPEAAPLDVAARQVVTAFLAWHETPQTWIGDELLEALRGLCEAVRAAAPEAK